VEALAVQWRDQFAQLPNRALADGPLAPANLGFLGSTGSAQAMGEHFPPAMQVEGLRRALLNLSAEQVLSVVAGLDTLPAGHHGLRLGFQSLAVEAFTRAGAALVTAGVPWERVREVLYQTVRYSPQANAMVAALERELRGQGVSPEQVDRLRELIQQLDWENQTIEEKLRQTLEQDKLWSLTLDQRLRFLRRLLEEGRAESFMQVLDQLLAALGKDPAGQREMAAQTLTGVVRWLAEPGLPPGAEEAITKALAAHFAWEPLLHIHRATADSMALILARQVHLNQPSRALTLMAGLGELVARQDPPVDWRKTALAKLRERLADPALLRKAAEQLHTAAPEAITGELIPYFTAMGQPAGQVLMEMLGEEPDRKRRGRLLEAIRAMGMAALPAIQEGLASSTWYLVRNALNLLGEMGDPETLGQVGACLRHPDPRVQRAAARTMYKIGGANAVPALLAAFPNADPQTQEEIMFGLGQLRATHAIHSLALFAQERRNPEKLRARAAETIGQIGDTRAVPVLTELARRRGRIFTSAEPLEVRLAACRALLALENVAATEALAGLVAAEPWSKDRTALQQVLDSRRNL
jgi:HEAT repeat protein